MKNVNAPGFSLLELLITISLMTILIAVGMVSHTGFPLRVKAEILNAQLLRAISMARSEAVLHGRPVSLCKSRDHLHCQGNWQDGQILFLDDHEDGTVVDKKHVLYVFNARHPGELHWRSAFNRDYLQILPSGISRADNGTFWYCPKAGANPIWAIFVSQSGRARSAYPDHEGKIENLTC